MIVGKKYRVVCRKWYADWVGGALVAVVKLYPLTVELLHPHKRMDKGATFWGEESELELIPEELQNESIETILLYYSL